MIVQSKPLIFTTLNDSSLSIKDEFYEATCTWWNCKLFILWDLPPEVERMLAHCHHFCFPLIDGSSLDRTPSRALWCKKIGVSAVNSRSLLKWLFGTGRCMQCPSSVNSKSCHWMIWGFHLKSLRKMTSAFSAPTQAKVNVAGLVNEL